MLALLVAVVVPVVIANGDKLAVPVVALVVLGETAVMVVGARLLAADRRGSRTVARTRART